MNTGHCGYWTRTMAGGRLGMIACAVALAVPGLATASPTQQTIVQDDDQLLYNGPGRTNESLDQLKALGVEKVRVTIHWGNVAPDRREDVANPTNPAGYEDSEFDGLDHLLRAARSRGIDVLLTVTGPAPAWAVRRQPKHDRRPVYRPDAGAYAQFVEMLGRRYSGDYADENQGGGPLPRVSTWSLWNEPNWHTSLMPQWTRDKRGRKLPAAGRVFRNLYRAGLDGLARSGHGSDRVLIGETAPLGSTKRTRRSPLKPGVFLRQLFCLNRDLTPMRGRRYKRNACDFHKRGPLRADAYAHHPYPIMSPPDEGDPDPDRFKLADAPELTRLLDAATAAGRLSAQLDLWWTEFGWQTEPDPLRGIPLTRHARWLGEAERISYDNPRVAVHGQFLLRDDEPRAHEPAGSSAYWVTWQSGLMFADGAPKPALDAFRLPLVAPRSIPEGSPLELWGVVRPADHRRPTEVLVQRRADPTAQWESIGSVAVVDARGFTATVPEPLPGDYRFVWQPPAEPAAQRGLFGAVPSAAGRPAPVASSAVYVAVK